MIWKGIWFCWTPHPGQRRPITSPSDFTVFILNPTSRFHGMSSRCPLPQEFPDLMVKPSDAGFSQNVPMERCPTPNDRVQESDHVDLCHTSVGFDECAHLLKQRRHILIGRRYQQLAIVLSGILTKEVFEWGGPLLNAGGGLSTCSHGQGSEVHICWSLPFIPGPSQLSCLQNCLAVVNRIFNRLIGKPSAFLSNLHAQHLIKTDSSSFRQLT